VLAIVVLIREERLEHHAALAFDEVSITTSCVCVRAHASRQMQKPGIRPKVCDYNLAFAVPAGVVLAFLTIVVLR
jgi:hypothetical protein